MRNLDGVETEVTRRYTHGPRPYSTHRPAAAPGARCHALLPLAVAPDAAGAPARRVPYHEGVAPRASGAAAGSACCLDHRPSCPAFAQSAWTTKFAQDAITDEEAPVAITMSADGHSLAVMRREDGTPWLDF